jgi:hypothetical protein
MAYLIGGKFAGYVGLVYVDWRKKTAEVSSMFELDDANLNFPQVFTSAHMGLIATARRLGLKSIYAEVYSHREKVQALLEGLDFLVTNEVPFRNKRRLKLATGAKFFVLTL